MNATKVQKKSNNTMKNLDDSKKMITFAVS